MFLLYINSMEEIIQTFVAHSTLMRLVLFVAGLLLSLNTLAQNNVGLKYFGLSIHPKGEKDNAFLMPHKLDKEAYLVLNIGGVLSYEHFIYKDILSIKVAQALYADCAARTGGFSHIGLRGRILKTGKHLVSGGIGPTLVYRRSWLELEGYKNQNRFKGNKDSQWQYLFLWYGGEFEYKYAISKALDFSASFVPGYPDLMSLSLGVNYKLQRRERS